MNLTDSFLSLSVLGQLGEAHWLWFRRRSSGGGGGILVSGIVPPAHFRGRDSTACTHLITKTCSYQMTRITIRTISATAIRAPMIPPTIGPTPPPAGVENLKVPPSMYKEEHLSFSCIELY